MTLHWNDDQDYYIVLHADMGANWLALQLNRTPHAINQRAVKLRKIHKLKLKSYTKMLLSQSMKQLVLLVWI